MNIYNHEITITHPPHVFGDGNHETTRFLLYYLNRNVSGKTYMDLGCGTGILSIFADKRGAKSVTAIDHDVHAIECTQHNAEINGSSIQTVESNVRDVDMKADIVTANFARQEALVYVPIAKRFVNDGGLLMTTWLKELPQDELTKDCTVLDYIEGVEYNAFVLQNNGR